MVTADKWAGVDAKYRRLTALAGLAAPRFDTSLKLIHAYETRPRMSTLTDVLRIAPAGPSCSIG